MLGITTIAGIDPRLYRLLWGLAAAVYLGLLWVQNCQCGFWSQIAP